MNAVRQSLGAVSFALCLAMGEANAARCLDSNGAEATPACRSELRASPRNTSLRIALADALMAGRRYEEAVAVLATGVELAPGNAEFKDRLKLAESYVREQEWIQQQQSGQSDAKGGSAAQSRRNVIRCTRLKGKSALSACDQALREKPQDTQLLSARGDALLGLGRYGEAVSSYRQALAFDPGDSAVAGKLSQAESQRRKALNDCRLLDGRDGLEACHAALLEGAGDEFVVRVRQADLLLAQKREEEALQAYRSAQKLDPRNTLVQQAIKTLTTPVAPAKPVEPRVASSKPTGNAAEESAISEDRAVPEEAAPPPPPRTVEVQTPASDTGSAPASTTGETQALPGIVESPTAPEPIEIATGPEIPEPLPDALPEIGSELPAEQEPLSGQPPVEALRYSNAPVAPGITY
ncbi:MAG: tetratricopeptide repeat protein [Pseudomonadota bacterium]|nr:tetratricopeptide repeat protein [Pseudomonadota bacterium]